MRFAVNQQLSGGLSGFYELESHVSSCLHKTDLIGRRSLVYFVAGLVMLSHNFVCDCQRSEVFFCKVSHLPKCNYLASVSVTSKDIADCRIIDPFGD